MSVIPLSRLRVGLLFILQYFCVSEEKGELFFALPTPFWPYCISIAPSLIVTLLLLMLVKAPMSGIALSRLLDEDVFERALVVGSHDVFAHVDKAPPNRWS